MSERIRDIELRRRSLFGLAGLGVVSAFLSGCGEAGPTSPKDAAAFTLIWIDMLPDHLKTGPESAEALATARRIQERLAGVAGGLGRLVLGFYDARRDAMGQPIRTGYEGPVNSWSGLTVLGQDAAHNTVSATFGLASNGIVRSQPQSARLDFAGTGPMSYIQLGLNAKGEGKAMWGYDGIDPSGGHITTADPITSLAQLRELETNIGTQLRLIPAADLP